MERLWVAIATGGYLSYIPVTLLGKRKWSGAGIIGTLEGLALMPFLPKTPVPFAVFLAVSIAAACWICGKAEKALGSHDDPRIVLDEVVGFWTTVAFLPAVPKIWLAGFVLFRLFDSCKLPPYSRLEKLPGGLGVVGDDVGAGIVANLCLRILIVMVPQLF